MVHPYICEAVSCNHHTLWSTVVTSSQGADLDVLNQDMSAPERLRRRRPVN